MNKTICYGSTPIQGSREAVRGEFVEEDARTWYRIVNFDSLAPFFTSVTNPGDIWMFLSTTGGITSGRTSKETALFPYVPVDKVHDAHTHTGALTILQVHSGSKTQLWVPLDWSGTRVYEITRTFYKSVHGDAVMFEETNRSLGLVFRSGWEASPAYGIRRFARLRNLGDSPVSLRVLDGLRNVLPAGVTPRMQSLFSNLLDAYKRSESALESGLGIFSLSATPTDLAEPSESLRATTIWSYGLESGTLLLSEEQVPAFVAGEECTCETDVKGRRGAYLRVAELELPGGGSKEWGFCADLEQNHAAVHNLNSRLHRDKGGLVEELRNDVRAAQDELVRILKQNDALQRVGSKESEYHHRSNVLFNIMRGGYFVDGYRVRSGEFARFVREWNARAYAAVASQLEKLPDTMSIVDLRDWCARTENPLLRRLGYEYLPLTFSRRHGDPSRPWNEFHIRTRDSSGNPIIGYQGNWRDIFQNWEALYLSYPDYFPSVIVKFLNATTADGYNPYRITHDGFDWEVPEPENPWSNIGYWGDHQIVYLGRLLEHAEAIMPGRLSELINDPIFVFANVPYRIKPFSMLIENPRDSIDFDYAADEQIRALAKKYGADGRLILDRDQQPLRATMIEKLLILLLAKTGNYVAGGGIWLNTQRPEWNDANNALAGWGLSVVTVSYLLRFVDTVDRLVSSSDLPRFTIHTEVARWLRSTNDALRSLAPEKAHTPDSRFTLLELLGTIAEKYREGVYENGLSSESELDRAEVEDYISLWRGHLVSTLERAHTAGEGFQSYQLLQIQGREAHVRPLYLMLEGQVAGLSSGMLPVGDVLALLDTLRSGSLYREDQHSYMLYPNRELPGFLEKNRIEPSDAAGLSVLGRPERDWSGLLERDTDGFWHFDGSFRNARDVEAAAGHLSPTERDEILALFEKTFDHNSFTGRSGTFFGFEGLGSIYWHMVSKLLLAVQEQLIGAVLRGEPSEVILALKKRYMDVRAGLGFNKDPATYGAVPTDPYSHTPWGQGAKQPGMTGQVKEEIIARFAELGLVIRDAQICFVPELILDDQWQPGTKDLAFSYCGVTFEVAQSDHNEVQVTDSTGAKVKTETLEIPTEQSAEIFHRSGRIRSVRVEIREEALLPALF